MNRGRSILGASLVVLAAACASRGGGSATAGLDEARLDSAITAIAQRTAPAALGVAVRDLETGDTWHHQGERRFPMQSVFKAPLGAAVLAAVDRGELALDSTIVLTPATLSPPYSPISAAFPERRAYTVEELLVAASGGSDNTAADVLMRLVGGPEAVTRWLESHGIEDLRIDRYEHEFQVQVNGMPPFRPEWATEDAFVAALGRVPEAQRRAATAAYLADPRDTSTPRAAAEFLERLAEGDLLSTSSTERLLRIMTETRTGARRIRAALPEGAQVAHKTGSARTDQGMTPAINDIGVVTLPDGRRVIIAIFLAEVAMPFAEAEAVHAEVTRAVLSALRPS